MADKIGKTGKNELACENIYGGFKYRFSYDEYMRVLDEKLVRREKRGRRAFFATFSFVFAMSLCSLLFAISYVGLQEEPEQHDNAKTVKAVLSPGCIYDMTAVGGNFVIESVRPETTLLYRIPAGVVVTMLSEVSAKKSDMKLKERDIIYKVDGVQTPDVATFQSVIAEKPPGYSFAFSVYREGEEVMIDCVIDEP
ncbi:MAG: serine protease [Clostridiales bacterium]|nr:serine protease [Clostridiales bacterium]